MSIVTTHWLQVLVEADADLSQDWFVKLVHFVTFQSWIQASHLFLNRIQDVIGSILITRLDPVLCKHLADLVLGVQVQT